MAKRSHSRVSGSDALDCQSLGSSLKRVRISASPGELRLERDLKMLTKQRWTHVSEKLWVRNGGTTRLERHTSRLVLTVRKVHVSIQIPRLYPHRPPVVSQVSYPPAAAATRHPTLCPTNHRVERVLVCVEPPFANDNDIVRNRSPAKQFGTVMYDRWSPVQTIHDLLLFVEGLLNEQHGQPGDERPIPQAKVGPMDVESEGKHQQGGSFRQRLGDLALLEESHSLDEWNQRTGKKLTESLAPNRFDLGYEKPLWTRDLMET